MYLLVCIATFEELRASKAGGAFDPLAWVALVTVIIGVPLCSLVALARMTEDDYEDERTQQLWNAAGDGKLRPQGAHRGGAQAPRASVTVVKRVQHERK